jgi:hypothetical protein
VKDMRAHLSALGLQTRTTPATNNDCLLYAVLPQLGLMPNPENNRHAAGVVAKQWRARIHSALKSELAAASDLGHVWRAGILEAVTSGSPPEPESFVQQYLRGVAEASSALGPLELDVVVALLRREGARVALTLYHPALTQATPTPYQVEAGLAASSEGAQRVRVALVPSAGEGECAHWEAVMPAKHPPPTPPPTPSDRRTRDQHSAPSPREGTGRASISSTSSTQGGAARSHSTELPEVEGEEPVGLPIPPDTSPPSAAPFASSQRQQQVTGDGFSRAESPGAGGRGEGGDEEVHIALLASLKEPVQVPGPEEQEEEEGGGGEDKA